MSETPPQYNPHFLNVINKKRYIYLTTETLNKYEIECEKHFRYNKKFAEWLKEMGLKIKECINGYYKISKA